MINIILKGVDEFLGSYVEKDLTTSVSKILKVDENEVYVTCLHSTIYHGEVDQTSFHMIVSFEMENIYQQYEQELVDFIFKISNKFAVHAHVNFLYISKTYSSIDETYPLFVNKSNEVTIEENDEEEEIYTGNIFANFEEELKK